MTDFYIEQKEGDIFTYNNFRYDLSDSEKAATALSRKVENTPWLIVSSKYGYAYLSFEAYKCDWTHD